MRRSWLPALILLALAPPLFARADSETPAPPRAIVAAGNRIAAQTGLDILRQGGNAVDAAVAIQAMLGLVEPQSSGIAGGAYLLFYDAASHTIEGWDGRETAPAAAGPDLFLHADGTPMAFHEAAVGGRSVGVPGVMPMLEAVHKAHGRMPWADLFAPGIRQAEAGFDIPARLADEIAADASRLKRQPALAAMFLRPDGAPLPAGAHIANPALADALRQIAAGGSEALMRGPLAGEIATAVRTDPHPGLMTVDDLAAYQPKQRPPVCLDYHEHRVCSAAPSTSGGVTLLQTLGMLSGFDMAARDPAAPSTAFLMLEAERLALADRARYLGDPDFAAPGTPTAADLLAPTYLASRAALIDPPHAIGHPVAGDPAGMSPAAAPQAGQLEHGTSDIAIVDPEGNAVAMTTTIEDAFGARLMVHGFLLNNELTDFAFVPEKDGRPVANRVQPGKRPRSSMAPTITFDRAGHLESVVGSAGGGRIIFYVAQALLGMLDWHDTPAEALALPHVGALDRRGDLVVELEKRTPAEALATALQADGETVQLSTMTSGTQAIRVTPAGPTGAADPRRDGAALSE